MIELLRNLHEEESGQDLVEYALIAGLVSIVVPAVLPALAVAITGEFATITGAL